MSSRREASMGIAIVRPPGHHAESNTAGGFCIYNNAAVAANAAQSEYQQVQFWCMHALFVTVDIGAMCSAASRDCCLVTLLLLRQLTSFAVLCCHVQYCPVPAAYELCSGVCYNVSALSPSWYSLARLQKVHHGQQWLDSF